MTSHDSDIQHARPLNRQDIKTLLLASLGGALEFYDFVIFVYFANSIGKLFFPPDMPAWLKDLQTYGIFAAGYLARPVGGIVMAHFGDMLGRKRMFTLSVFLMAVPTLLVGLLPTYSALGYGAPILLLVLRILQGAAIGGEVPGAWVFVSEHVPAKRVGMACGMLTGGLTSGILLGSLAATAVNVNLAPEQVLDYGWRIPFFLGGLLGLLAVYLRSYLQETPVFEEISRMKKLAEGLPVRQVLREHKGAVMISITITWMLTAAIVVMILLTPSLLPRLFAISQALALQGNSVATLALSISCLLMGMACDRFGPAPVSIIGTVGLAASSFALYAAAPGSPELVVPLYGVTGFFVGMIAVVPVVMVRAFPAAVRFSGISLSYNLSYALFGGLTPTIVPLMVAASPFLAPLYVTVAALAGTLTITAWSKRGEPEE